MLKLTAPSHTDEATELADWLELQVLTTPSRSYSAAELIDAIEPGLEDVDEEARPDQAEEPLNMATGGLLEGVPAELLNGDAARDEDDQDEDVEPGSRSNMDRHKILEDEVDGVFRELRLRSEAAIGAYPFSVGPAVIKACDDWSVHVPYVFCLTLSYLARTQPTALQSDGRKLFELVATEAAAGYLGDGGEAFAFGAPRRAPVPSSFSAAIDYLVAFIAEGVRDDRRKGSRLRPQDHTVDVVAVSHFPDLGPGKLVLFGACATNGDLAEIRRKRASELEARRFCETWLRDVPPSPVVSAFFMPHRQDPHSESYEQMCLARDHQLVFERCRIALHADKRCDTWPEHAAWLTHHLGQPDALHSTP